MLPCFIIVAYLSHLALRILIYIIKLKESIRSPHDELMYYSLKCDVNIDSCEFHLETDIIV